MKKLYLMVGPPGSGKSTYSRHLVSSGAIYVNQDLQGKDHINLFNVAVANDMDIVVDRMGFSKGQRNRYLDPAKARGYETEIIVIHQPYKVCYERCVARKDHATIKDSSTASAALNTFFTKYERVTDDEANVIKRVFPEGDKPSAVICDLDGTLCNVSHRRHFVRRPEGVKKDWQGFFKGMVDDKPNKWCVDILKAMSKDHTIVYCSGRPDNWRKETNDWLVKHDMYTINIKHGTYENGSPQLYMRPRGDNRQDNIAKEIILDFEILTRFTPYFMIDDRDQVVKMWRDRGYTCLQCDDGNF